ncbi:MAG: toll/interleukin-1 receptor domain-containing protein [Bacteroidia bacterium]
MDIFISWSGDTSKKVAEHLKQFLPSVIQILKPFYSSEDISKGKRWSNEISEKLYKCDFGIVILTKDNLKSPWIMFESGALSKNIETGRVCTLLLGIHDTDVQSPLTEFQNTKFTKNDVYKLLLDINNQLGKNAIDNTVLSRVYDKMWPELEKDIKAILVESTKLKPKEEVRSDRELLEESVRYLRQMNYKHLLFDSDNFEFDRGSKVLFDVKKETINFYEGKKELYSIHIHQLSDTAEVLDFFFQVSGKGWCKSKHIKGFLDCIEEISDKYFDQNAQGIFCPFGSFRKIDWEKKKSNAVKLELD